MSDRIHDLVGIGFGPSNLALAIALHERGSGLDRVFLESRPGFAWHPGMMIHGADMQVSFLKDLVSLHNPASRFSFLCYLHDKGRLERFINRKTFFPSRVEFNDYLSWAAAKLGDVCAYDQRVTAVEPAERRGEVTHLRIHAENSAGERSLRLARQIVLAPGGQPNWPEPFGALRGLPGISHSNDFTGAVLPHVAPGQHVAVLGGGQSAAEIFAELAGHPAAPAVDLILRGHALKPSDDSPFVNEIFGADHTQLMFGMDPQRRKALLDDFASTNYAVADLDLLQKIYDLLYEQEVEAGSRLRLLRDTRPIAAKALPGGIALTLEGPAGRHQMTYDHVILGTGYRRDLAASVLAGLSPWMQAEQPDRFYRLPMRQGFRPAIYVQGYSEPTHGLSDTLLSILAVRAQEIAAAAETFRARRLIAAE
ncbi:lysine N(6)-hydroxylase/L-ornithine N(5)-oxygenase family protein [Paracoccus siganidrum]|uniref:Ornithine monooxygenase n=1 Tax=Paracoccus siganidrum TaxID=1276757 RepID=A0A419A643_9RHOB|nr:SidA/IucD/PvdA family monooxygenase [Paracoccus siganidrum]RJL13076.1 ornithine monooxygenase [Paracoccus siganidrum]RMC33033.1 ornithine monooxygenase [Paracoccus siganidrum]